MADELTTPRPEGEENVEDIQILLKSNAVPLSLRNLKVSHVCFLYTWMCTILCQFSNSLQSEFVSRLVKISGIIISATGVRAKATKIAIQCRSCRNVLPNLLVKPGLEGYILPRKCTT